MLGQTVAGRYLIESRLGKGGMGVVYRGRQEPLGRPVALKVLADNVAGDPAVVQRFEKEAQAVSRLNHPNIVTVYEFGRTDDGLLFLAMELIEGESLHQRLLRGPFDAEPALEIVTQVTRALAEAHAQGVVHRDLKPENIMLIAGRQGELVVKVLDFGLAKMVGTEQSGAPLTSASIIMGTPGYMSPEQIHARPLDARTDLYSLGMVWWELLVGRRPFDGGTPIELLVKHLQRPLPPPSSARPQLALPANMERLVLRLGNKDANERPSDGGALLGELRALRDDAWTVNAHGAALAGSSDDDWDQAFAAVSEASSAPTAASTQRFSLPPPSAPDSIAPEVTNQDAAPLFAPTPAAARPPAPLEPPAHAASPAWPPPPAAVGAPAFAGPAASVDASSAPARAAPPASLAEPELQPELQPEPRPELQPEPRLPPRPLPASAFRPPPDPLAGAEPLELERKQPGAPTHYPEAPAAPAPDVKWQVRSGGAIQGPLTFRELLALVRAGTVRGSDEAAPLGEPFRPLESHPLLMRELASRRGAPLTGRATGAHRSSRFRRVALLSLFAAAAAAGVGFGLFPETVKARLQPLFGGLSLLGAAAGVEVGPHPLAAYFPKWRNELGVPTASEVEALALGRVAQKRETVLGRKEADAAFRLGLLVAPESQTLLPAFVENRAWLRALGQPAGGEPLEATLAYARARRDAADDALLLRAQAALTLLAGRTRERKTEQAEAALLRAEALDGSDVETQLLLALARLDRPAEAKRHAQKALQLLPGSTRAKLVYGMATRRLGQHDDALKHLEARVRAEPKDALAARELASALLERGLLRRATRALELAYASSGDPVTARLFALTLLQDPAAARRADSLLAEASKRAASDPDGAPLLALRARLLTELGQAQHAVVVAEDLARRSARQDIVQAALARAYQGSGRVLEARRAFQAAEALAASQPEAARLAQERGDLELRAGERKAAGEAYQQSLALAPERAGPRLALALLALERDDEEAARVALMGLLEIDPRQDRDRERIDAPFGGASYDLYHERAAKLSPAGASLVSLLVRGVAAFHQGDLRAAERALSAALKKDRTQPVALLYAAALDVEEGDERRAYRRLQLLEASAPGAAAAALYLARIEATLRPRAAETRLDRLQAAGRFTVEVSVARGAALAARGRAEEATRHYQAAFVRDPSYLPARRALASAPVPLE